MFVNLPHPRGAQLLGEGDTPPDYSAFDPDYGVMPSNPGIVSATSSHMVPIGDGGFQQVDDVHEMTVQDMADRGITGYQLVSIGEPNEQGLPASQIIEFAHTAQPIANVASAPAPVSAPISAPAPSSVVTVSYPIPAPAVAMPIAAPAVPVYVAPEPAPAPATSAPSPSMAIPTSSLPSTAYVPVLTEYPVNTPPEWFINAPVGGGSDSAAGGVEIGGGSASTAAPVSKGMWALLLAGAAVLLGNN